MTFTDPYRTIIVEPAELPTEPRPEEVPQPAEPEPAESPEPDKVPAGAAR